MQLTKKELKPIEEKISAFGLSREVIEKETAFALQTINSNDKLLQCKKHTILAAIVQAANIGLSLNPAKQEAALIPRKTQGGYECSLMPMYRGIANLAYTAGNITQISTIEVCKNDEIRFTPYDNQNPVQHAYGFGDRGDAVGYYTLITYKDGNKQVESMTIDEVLKIREGSDGYRYAKKYGRGEQHPWGKWFSEMARKTCLKRALKYANKVGADDKLAQVIELDNQDYKPSQAKLSYIERLISSSTFDDEYKFMLEEGLPDISVEEADQMITNLQAHQIPGHPGWDERMNKTNLNKAANESAARENT